ncbi:hypothetical protein V5799_029913 [Amblyomma americanum]|uniref:Uncharacterized protein n=1 Tax=Amblyomma americanum TaxID=6943 RepID=A0AAQ4EQC3_AMBAM
MFLKAEFKFICIFCGLIWRGKRRKSRHLKSGSTQRGRAAWSRSFGLSLPPFVSSSWSQRCWRLRSCLSARWLVIVLTRAGPSATPSCLYHRHIIHGAPTPGSASRPDPSQPDRSSRPSAIYALPQAGLTWNAAQTPALVPVRVHRMCHSTHPPSPQR